MVGTNSKKQVHILKYLGVGTNELLQVTTMKKRSTDIKIRQLCIFSIMKISDCQIVVLDPNQQSTRIGGGGGSDKENRFASSQKWHSLLSNTWKIQSKLSLFHSTPKKYF